MRIPDKDTITLNVNGESVELKKGSTIADALEHTDSPHNPGTSVGILKVSEEYRKEGVTSYRIITSKGEIEIELNDPEKGSVQTWIQIFKRFEGKSVRWVGRDAVAFGSISADISIEREPASFDKFDVLFGAGGYDPDNTHLIISRQKHTGEYGQARDGTFGRVISGKNILMGLDKSDEITEIKPVIKWEQAGDSIFTSDLTTKLEHDDQVFSFIGVEMSPNAPYGVKHFFTLINDGSFKVDSTASAYICDRRLQGEKCRYENFEPRVQGSVSVRTAGYGTGKVFVSRTDMPATIMHSVIGHVREGIELVNMALPGHRLTVLTVPDQIMLSGMSLHEARQLLSESGVNIIVEGYEGDDAVVVEQRPETTIEILGGSEVAVKTIPSSNLVKIRLYDDLAPKSIDYFRSSVGLKFNRVGTMKADMIYDTTYIFDPEKDLKIHKEIFPENTPSKMIHSGDIGITNQASKRMGTIGIKIEDDDLFGPTGEKFANTNIIGKVLEPHKLKDLKEGDFMYIVEMPDVGEDDVPEK